MSNENQYAFRVKITSTSDGRVYEGKEGWAVKQGDSYKVYVIMRSDVLEKNYRAGDVEVLQSVHFDKIPAGIAGTTLEQKVENLAEAQRRTGSNPIPPRERRARDPGFRRVNPPVGELTPAERGYPVPPGAAAGQGVPATPNPTAPVQERSLERSASDPSGTPGGRRRKSKKRITRKKRTTRRR